MKSFLDHIAKEKLFSKKDRILLAVSGGIDSVVMCELFHKHGFHFAIAHCNFQLRGKESDGDERFVKKLAKKYDVPFFVAHFDTQKEADKKKISIQMAARDLRYEWFEKVRSENHFDYIATAHHLNDSIETVMINLVRGTGIAGLHGIAAKRGAIIRPLLFLKREEIEHYAKEHKLKHHEDSSNASTKYLRNKIRKKIIPVLKELNPGIEQTFRELIEKAKQAESFIEESISRIKKDLITQKNDDIFISIEKLQSLAHKELILFYLLKEYHFNETTVRDILSGLDKQAGKKFFSSSHQLIKDRKHLILSLIDRTPATQEELGEGLQKMHTGKLNMAIRKINIVGFRISNDPSIASLDHEKLTFPLKLRKWKNGDRFVPLGMKSEKKLSDFFTGEKLSIKQKENTFVLTSGDEIVWVVGLRIDDRYKITTKTKTVYQLTLTK